LTTKPAMVAYDKVANVFYMTDEICKDFENFAKSFILGKPSKRPGKMVNDEVMTIPLFFHLSGFRCFKHFYVFYVQRHMQREFPNTVSYNRFVELERQVILPMTVFLKSCCFGKVPGGISFVGSTPIRACNDKRIKANKVLKGIATVGPSPPWGGSMASSCIA